MIPSPNIWEHPDTYELLNRAADPNRLVWSALAVHARWAYFFGPGCEAGIAEPFRSSGASSDGRI